MHFNFHLFAIFDFCSRRKYLNEGGMVVSVIFSLYIPSENKVHCYYYYLNIYYLKPNLNEIQEIIHYMLINQKYIKK